MEQILLNGLSVEQLIERLSKLIEEKLNSSPPEKANHLDYLSRVEVSKVLKISLVTLHELTKKGAIASYKIGNRVLYKPGDVEQALKQRKLTSN